MKLRKPDRINIYTETGSTDGVDVKFNAGKVTLTADQTPVRYLRFRWNFTECEKRNEPVKILGDEWERAYATMEWRGIVPVRTMPWVCIVSNGSDSNLNTAGRFTECFGVKVRPGAMCFWQYDGAGVTLWADVRCGGMGVILGGRTLDVCQVVFGEYRDMSAFRAARAYYKTLCDDALTIDHKVYGNNNWYYAYGKSSQEEILADTELLVSCCEGLENRPYMVIDDGWSQTKGDAPWDVLNERFYDMKQLAKDITERGARPGIWFRPLADKKKELPLNTPEVRAKWRDMYLDPSHPDVLDYVAKTVSRLSKEWGYKLIKHDFSSYDMFGAFGFQMADAITKDGWCFYDRGKTSAEIVLQLYRTIKEAAAEDTLILGCNVIGHLAAGLVHLNRTGDDTSGKEWERTRAFGVNTLAFRMPHHEAFYHADADCVGITEHIDPMLNLEWLRALTVSGTSLFVSPRPSVVDDRYREALKAAYARNSIQADVLEPLDWMENMCPNRWLLNGEEIEFHWYSPDGVENFKG